MTTGRRYVEAAPTESPYRWVMLGLICLLYLSFGLVSASLAPLLSNIQADLHISDALTGSALAAWQLVYVFFAIPAGAFIERLGPKRGLAVAGLLIALSQILRATAFGFPSLFAGIAVFGLGGPLVSIGAPATIARWFNAQERPMATGMYSVSPAIGSVIALFTANSVFMPLTGQSWRLTLAIFGSIAVVASLAWMLLAREAELPPETAVSSRGDSSLGRFLAVGRIPTVQIMLGMAIGIFMFSHGTTNWLPTLLHRQGYSKADAGAMSSLPTIFGIIAALSATNFVARGKSREYQVLGFVFLAGAIALATVPSTRGIVQLGALVLLGFGLNAAGPLMMIILMGMPKVGPRNMGIAGGLWYTFGEIGGVLGPTLVGVISGAAGLQYGFYMLATISSVLLLATFILYRSAARDALEVESLPAAAAG